MLHSWSSIWNETLKNLIEKINKTWILTVSAELSACFFFCPATGQSRVIVNRPSRLPAIVKGSGLPDNKVHGAHLGPTGPRWAPCWPYEPCYLGASHQGIALMSLVQVFSLFLLCIMYIRLIECALTLLLGTLHWALLYHYRWWAIRHWVTVILLFKWIPVIALCHYHQRNFFEAIVIVQVSKLLLGIVCCTFMYICTHAV